jgi:hypothetical protein
MKILLIVTCLCLASFISFAQQERPVTAGPAVLIDDINPQLDLQINLTDKVLKAKRKKGKQLIASVKAVNLYVEIQKGEVIKYLATNADGNSLKITQTKLSPTCQLCVDDSEEGTICWTVDATLVPDSATDQIK